MVLAGNNSAATMVRGVSIINKASESLSGRKYQDSGPQSSRLAARRCSQLPSDCQASASHNNKRPRSELEPWRGSV